MKSIKWFVLACFLLMVAVSLMSGCGDKEKTEFKAYYDKTVVIREKFKEKMNEMDKKGQEVGNDKEAINKLLDDFIAEMTATKTELEAIKPPERMTDAHKELVAAFQSSIELAQSAKQITEMDFSNIEKLDAKTMKKFQKIAEDLTKKQEEAENHIKAHEEMMEKLLKEKGIDISGEEGKKEETKSEEGKKEEPKGEEHKGE